LSFRNFPGGVFGGEGCADVQGGSLANSTPVNAYNCTAAPNQQFEFSGQTIYALGGQTCLDHNGFTPGTPVDSYPVMAERITNGFMQGLSDESKTLYRDV
jgi:hypothetical protein